MPRPPSPQRPPDRIKGADIRRTIIKQRTSEDRAYLRRMISHLESTLDRSGFLASSDVAKLQEYRVRYASL